MKSLDLAEIKHAFSIMGEFLRDKKTVGEIAVYGGGAILLQFRWRGSTRDVDATVISDGNHGLVRQAADRGRDQRAAAGQGFDRGSRERLLPERRDDRDFRAPIKGHRLGVRDLPHQRQLPAERGALTIDADRVVHELLDGDAAIQAAVAEAFGPGVQRADGRIDRAALGRVVFGVRKTSHVVEYAVLALLCWRARRQPIRGERRPWRWADAGFGFVVAVGAVHR